MTHEQLAAILTDRLRLGSARAAKLTSALRAAPPTRDILQIACEACDLDEAELLDALARHTLATASYVRLTQMTLDPASLRHVSAADAWDHLILPLGVESDGRLLCCTTDETLAAALGYLLRNLTVPFRLVLSNARSLEQFIAEQYHYEGIEAA